VQPVATFIQSYQVRNLVVLTSIFSVDFSWFPSVSSGLTAVQRSAVGISVRWIVILFRGRKNLMFVKLVNIDRNRPIRYR
jgi:hypothetical protein